MNVMFHNIMFLVATEVRFNVECGGSAVECPTRNQEIPCSNPLCYNFEVWAFLFSPRCPSSLSCTNEYQAIDGGGNVSK